MARRALILVPLLTFMVASGSAQDARAVLQASATAMGLNNLKTIQYSGTGWNALVGQSGLARTSNTPGRTQELNYFVPDGYSGGADDMPPCALVDMPGYGYAEAPKEQVDAWTKLVFDYLRGRSTLKRVYLLIDSRHGIKKNDDEVLDLLDKAAISYQVVLTKSDKIKPPALEKLKVETSTKIAKHPAAYPFILATSSEKSEGINTVRAAIIEVLNL